MSLFRKDSPEVRKAKEKYEIEKMKNRAERDRLKNLAKEKRIEARSKNGGVGGSFAFVDKRRIPQSSGKKRRRVG